MKNPTTVEAIFTRSKIRPASTWLWKTISLSAKTVISDKVGFNSIETPILSYYINPDQWWLLTTERIILNYDSIESICLEDIKSVKLNKLFEGDISKTDINAVQLEINSDWVDLEVEKGTWHVVYQMLRFMLNR